MDQVRQLFEYIFNAFKFWIIIQPWEQGIRVRMGNKVKLLKGGMYFKLPYLDSVYVQESRLRVISLSIQTLTTKDLKTITINSSLGYSITSIEKLYKTLYHPESTLQNMAMSEIADYIYRNDLSNITPSDIEKAVLDKLNSDDYGLKFEYFRITNFAAVRTYRLIQDNQSWVDNSLNMTSKR